MDGVSDILFNKINSSQKTCKTDDIFFFNNRYKAMVFGTTPTQRKLMFHKAVLVFKAYTHLAPPYPKQLISYSNSCATSRFIILSKLRTDSFKTGFSFPGVSHCKNASKVAQFTYQLQNTAPQMVQKQNVVTEIS